MVLILSPGEGRNPSVLGTSGGTLCWEGTGRGQRPLYYFFKEREVPDPSGHQHITWQSDVGNLLAKRPWIRIDVKLRGGLETRPQQPWGSAGTGNRELSGSFLKPFGDWSYLIFAPVSIPSEDGGVWRQNVPVPKSGRNFCFLFFHPGADEHGFSPNTGTVPQPGHPAASKPTCCPLVLHKQARHYFYCNEVFHTKSFFFFLFTKQASIEKEVSAYNCLRCRIS